MEATTTRGTKHNGVGRISPTSTGAKPMASSPRQPESRSTAPRTRFNRGRIALGLLILVLTSLGAATLYSSATNRIGVLGIAHEVPVGKTITETDLRKVWISGGDGLHTIEANDASRVVGKTALVRLVPGSLLSPDQIADKSSLPAGTVVSGAVLKNGQFPVGLAIGDSVDVVETTTSDTGDAPKAVSRGTATVVDLSELVDGQSSLTVSLAIPVESAVAVSSAGAAGRLSLVMKEP